jgi:hypothetical protein
MRKDKLRYYNATSSRRGGRRGCLCPNNTYSRKCCDGSLWAQGIGNITGTPPVIINYIYITTDDFIYVTSDNEIYLTVN